MTRYLQKRRADIRSIAVEPAESPVISGGSAGKHGIQGIGAGFIPQNLDASLLRRRRDGRDRRGLPLGPPPGARRRHCSAGISTGANVAVAARLAALPENAGKTIVTFASSSGERYLSTPLYELVGMASLPPALVG